VACRAILSVAHMKPVSRAGIERTTRTDASATASGPMNWSGEKPDGRSTPDSSATCTVVRSRASRSRSIASTFTSVVPGTMPIVPTTAASPSFEIVPMSRPGDASL
jgi:hypothetical protein